MFLKTAIVSSIVIVLIFIQIYRMNRGFRIYTSRGSQRETWRHLFPVEAHQQLIERMLEGFARSFLFTISAQWCFKPDDKIIDILNATDNNHTDHLQYDMFFVVLQDLGLQERPIFEEVDLRTVAEILIAAQDT